MRRWPPVPIGFANPDRRAIDREKEPKTYLRVPSGGWSGDGRQLRCLLQTLQDHWEDLDLAAFAQQFLAWRDNALHQSAGTVFDCGSATGTALDRVRAGVPARVEEEGHDRSQGNGALMRALPAALLPVGHRGGDEAEPGHSPASGRAGVLRRVCAVGAVLAVRARAPGLKNDNSSNERNFWSITTKLIYWQYKVDRGFAWGGL